MKLSIKTRLINILYYKFGAGYFRFTDIVKTRCEDVYGYKYDPKECTAGTLCMNLRSPSRPDHTWGYLRKPSKTEPRYLDKDTNGWFIAPRRAINLSHI
jgi:hypothetical protein